ncbi:MULTISPECIES: UPF0223 family protein [Listeria]|uniref:UPF0223 protein EP57_11080 n=2 Tax=Listeria TaxID=1637 RepID=A0A099W7M8_9LIST|nr:MULTISPECIES: UPF0223 family protein [Listeria]EUJ46869.1 hypothetical protein PRIP_01044 [Listeria riparia FSL S10-1204]KGL40428.1 hypothetical protein EP57_11080 [Listeria booriae]MBC1210097.1 UPF0223 family protein [Listeria booriae]MBC1225837.1 UPF0223 family protein [Listeria booriae]MBC1273207.1 UPF0223 family protein [Listeria booriae]
MEYSYPLNLDWSTEEIAIVINFYQAVEKAYETGIDASEIKAKYSDFKQVVRSIGEEKSLGREFEKASGYSAYRVMQLVKDATTSKIKMQP